MNATYTLLLTDGTIGKFSTNDYEVECCDVLTIVLHDENGNLISVTGEVSEILEIEGNI